eukprot:1154236-Pelagomonas_calceolata.AAC.4
MLPTVDAVFTLLDVPHSCMCNKRRQTECGRQSSCLITLPTVFIVFKVLQFCMRSKRGLTHAPAGVSPPWALPGYVAS